MHQNCVITTCSHVGCFCNCLCCYILQLILTLKQTKVFFFTLMFQKHDSDLLEKFLCQHEPQNVQSAKKEKDFNFNVVETVTLCWHLL